jgi:hypothetical protein
MPAGRKQQAESEGGIKPRQGGELSESGVQAQAHPSLTDQEREGKAGEEGEEKRT